MNVEKIKDDLEKHGYALCDALIRPEELETLRVECETLRELALSAGPSSSGKAWGAAAKASCIFETLPGHLCTANPHLRTSYDIYKAARTTWPLHAANFNLLFSSHLTQLITSLLGPSAVLFNDQFIVKPSFQRGDDTNNISTSFAWHRDSDWCRNDAMNDSGTISKTHNHHPYISVWIALDDATIENGCLIIRPGSHLAICPSKVAQKNSSEEKFSVDVNVDVPLCMTAGSAVIMVDTVEHCSGGNTSQYSRRAWMPQFSSQPILWNDDDDASTPVSLAIPLLHQHPPPVTNN